MATSNAIGSNVFDILICLGLPWFLQTAVVKPGSEVRVLSKGNVRKTRLLFFKCTES
jgi:sodium/potassium/calcium exchanger 4